MGYKTMKKPTYPLKLYLTTLFVFFAVDMVWLGLVAKTFYRNQIGFILADPVNWPAAILFYLLFTAGIVVFVVLPGLNSGSLRDTLLRAAFFGLITYATYDLTNLATLKDWPVILTVVDLGWGMILTVMVSYASIVIGRRLAK
jgi:uncharacterized membrane protein